MSFILDDHAWLDYGWSFKQRSASATQCIRIRRGSDDAETDIGFANEQCDEAAIATFCTGTTGYVTTMYEQGGVGTHNLVVTNVLWQPVIYEAGAVCKDQYGNIKCRLDTNQQRLLTANAVDYEYSATTSAAIFGMITAVDITVGSAIQGANGTFPSIRSNVTNDRLFVFRPDGLNSHYPASDSAQSPGSYASSFRATNGEGKFYVNDHLDYDFTPGTPDALLSIPTFGFYTGGAHFGALELFVASNASIGESDHQAVHNKIKNSWYVTDATGTTVTDPTPTRNLAFAVTADSTGDFVGGFQFTITRSGDVANFTSTVNVALTGDAVHGTDYTDIGGTAGLTTPSGTVTFAPGETTKTLNAQVRRQDHYPRTVTCTLTNAQTANANSSLTTPTANRVITNDDTLDPEPPPPVPTYTIAADTGGTNSGATFTITRSGITDRETEIEFTMGGDAIHNTHYHNIRGTALPAGTTGVITFADGETTKTLVVDVLGAPDLPKTLNVQLQPVSEGDETPIFTVDNVDRVLTTADVRLPSNVVDVAYAINVDKPLVPTVDIPTKTVTYSISDDGRAVTYSISADDAAQPTSTPDPPAVTSAGETVTFTISRTETGPQSEFSRVNYSVAGTAVFPTHYHTFGGTAGGAYPSGTVRFDPGETSKTITVVIPGRVPDPQNKTIEITLSEGTASGVPTIPTPQANSTILSDERVNADYAISVDKPSFGSSLPETVTFTVTRTEDGQTSQSSFVRYTAGGTAEYDYHYELAGGTANASDSYGIISFEPGETSKTIILNAPRRAPGKQDKTLSIELREPQATGEATISTPIATTNLVSDGNISVTYDVNFGHLWVPEDSTQGAVKVQVYAYIERWQHWPNLPDGRYSESPVQLDVDEQTTVNYTFAGTAVYNTDYTNLTGTPGLTHPTGSVTFAPGETSKLVLFEVDGYILQTEHRTVDIAIAGGTASGEILYRGANATSLLLYQDTVRFFEYGITVDKSVVPENPTGVETVTFTVTRNGPIAPSLSSTVGYEFSGTAEFPEHYRNVQGASYPVGNVLFLPGETSKTITIDVEGRLDTAEDRLVTLTILNPHPPDDSSISTPAATVTVLSKELVDTSYAIAVDKATVGDTPPETVTFTISRVETGGASQASTVDYTFAGTAEYTYHYENLGGTASPVHPSGTVSFAAGETSKTITASIPRKAPGVNRETIEIVLSNPTASGVPSITTERASTAILEDGLVSVTYDATVGYVRVPEDVGRGSETATVYAYVERWQHWPEFPGNVTSSRSPNLPVPAATTVDYAFAGTAVYPTHYGNLGGNANPTHPSGTVSFAAGETAKIITFDVAGYIPTPEARTTDITISSGTGSGEVLLFRPTMQTTLLQQGVLYVDHAITVDKATIPDSGGAETVTFTITRTGVDVASRASRVSYAASGTAVYPTHYRNIGGTSGASSPTGFVDFAPGEVSKTITADVDGKIDTTEDRTLIFTIGDATPPIESISTASATTTILHEPKIDIDYALDVDKLFIPESGTDVPDTVTFTVTRTESGTPSETSTVDYTFGGDAVYGEDYGNIGGTSGATNPTGTVTFAPGETSKTITADVPGLAQRPGMPEIRLTLSNPTASGTPSISVPLAVVTIFNDTDVDIDYRIDTNKVSVPTGTQPETVTFTVSRVQTGNVTEASTVNYTFSGTAVYPDHYSNLGGTANPTHPAGTVTFAAHENSKTITIDVAGRIDTTEPRTVILTLSSGTASGTATISQGTATTTILNRLNVNIDYTITTDKPNVPLDTGVEIVTFTVARTLEGDDEPSQVEFAFSGTAVYPTHYRNIGGTSGATGQTGTVVFADAERSKTITFEIEGKIPTTEDRTVIVTLSNGTASGNPTISKSSDTTTIAYEDAIDIAYGITVDKTSVPTGAGTETVTATVTRAETGVGSEASSIDFAFGGTATHQTHFYNIGGTSGAVGLNGTVNFAAGETSKTITYDIDGKIYEDSDRTVTITLSNPTASGTPTVNPSSVSTTIQHEPANNITYGVVVDKASVPTTTGVETVTLTVSRAIVGNRVEPVQVDYVLTGTAIYPTHYFNIGGTSGAVGVTGTVTFGPGETSKTITYQVDGKIDTTEDRTVICELSGGTASGNVTLDPVSAQTVLQHLSVTDTDYAIAVDKATVPTIAGEEIVTCTVTRTLTGERDQPTSVNFAFSGTALYGTHYYEIGGTAGATTPNGTVNFGVSETTKTITFKVDGKILTTEDRTAIVTLSSPTGIGTGNATISTASTTTTIEHLAVNDTTYGVIVDKPNVPTGTDPETVTFTVSRAWTGERDESTQVHYTFSGTAVYPGDFHTIGGSSGASGLTGVVAFEVGETSKTITVVVDGKVIQPTSRTIVVGLSSGTASGSVTIAPSSATSTIANLAPNNTTYGATVDKASVPEFDDNRVETVTFTISRTWTGERDEETTIDYVLGGTASYPEHYQNIGGTAGADSQIGRMTFAPGVQSHTITIDVQGKIDTFADRTVILTLSNGTASGSVTISPNNPITTILRETEPPVPPDVGKPNLDLLSVGLLVYIDNPDTGQKMMGRLTKVDGSDTPLVQLQIETGTPSPITFAQAVALFEETP